MNTLKPGRLSALLFQEYTVLGFISLFDKPLNIQARSLFLCSYHSVTLKFIQSKIRFFFSSSVFTIFIDFIGMTLVNKIIQVSCVQFYSISSIYCILFTTPCQISFHHHLSSFTLFYLPHPLSFCFPAYCCLCL